MNNDKNGLVLNCGFDSCIYIKHITIKCQQQQEPVDIVISRELITIELICSFLDRSEISQARAATC